MLLFDESKVLEKAIGEDATRMLDQVLSRYDESSKKELATKGDLLLSTEQLRLELERMRADLTEKIEAAKHETLKWFIGMAITQTGVLAALYALMK